MPVFSVIIVLTLLPGERARDRKSTPVKTLLEPKAKSNNEDFSPQRFIVKIFQIFSQVKTLCNRFLLHPQLLDSVNT